MRDLRITLKLIALFISISISIGNSFAQEPIKVNVENYVRAESDFQIETYAKTFGCFGKLVHQRDFYSVDNQLTL